MDYVERTAKVREEMLRRHIDALFLPSSGDRQYITGIPSERPCITHHHRWGDWLNGVFVTGDKIVYVAPWMVREAAWQQAEEKRYIDEVVIVEEGEDCGCFARELAGKLGLGGGVIAVPKVAMAKTLTGLCEAVKGISFVCTEDFTCGMRMIKDEEEISIMREASEIADEAFRRTVKGIGPGVSEYEIAAELDLNMMRLGAECVSFPTDVMIKGPGVKETGGSGFAKVVKGCNIAFDFGCVYRGYCSDFGRTVFVGEPSVKQRRIHELVMAAQRAAADALCKGQVTAAELDGIARRVINEGGYYEEFFHRLGHGIGVDVHEYPYLSRGCDEVLMPGMTITIEPSVMIPGELRIRVEDIFHITEQGVECLNAVTREIVVI